MIVERIDYSKVPLPGELRRTRDVLADAQAYAELALLSAELAVLRARATVLRILCSPASERA